MCHGRSLNIYSVHCFPCFTSPEPKAQVSFSYQNLSVFRRHCRCRSRCRRCRCRKVFTFSFYSPEILGQFPPNLDTTHPYENGIQVCSNEGPALF